MESIHLVDEKKKKRGHCQIVSSLAARIDPRAREDAADTEAEPGKTQK